MPYDIKPLSCEPKKLKGLSEKLIVSHWENNYGGAVKRLNALIATNSMILHELYFDGLGDGGMPDTVSHEALARDFGSLDRWRTEFVAMGKAMGGGAGWVLLTYSYRDRRLVNLWAADHTHSMAAGTPILALDMYEHSYHIDLWRGRGEIC